MYEALAKTIDYIFSDYKLHRIEAFVMPSNKESIKLLEKLDFINEGYSYEYSKINGVWEDHLRMSLINKTYRNSDSPLIV